MNAQKKLVNYGAMDKVELISVIEKQGAIIKALKDMHYIYEWHPNKVIEMNLDSLVMAVGETFKMTLDKKVLMLEDIREVIKRFII